MFFAQYFFLSILSNLYSALYKRDTMKPVVTWNDNTNKNVEETEQNERLWNMERRKGLWTKGVPFISAPLFNYKYFFYDSSFHCTLYLAMLAQNFLTFLTTFIQAVNGVYVSPSHCVYAWEKKILQIFPARIEIRAERRKKKIWKEFCQSLL